jgi:hypothetical protein
MAIQDDTSYPRSYGVKAGWKFFMAALGAAFLGGGLFGIWQMVQPLDSKTNPLVFAVLGLIGALFGVVMLGAAFVSKLLLEQDAIELRELFGTRRLARAQIKGRRTLPTNPPTLIVVPAEPGLRKISISAGMRSDAVLEAWLAALPDLDAAELRASEAEILHDAEGGATPDQRRGELAAAKRTANILTLAAVAVSVWGWFFPQPYYYPLLATLAALPWATMALAGASRGLYTLNDHKSDARAGVGTAFFMPGLVLFLRGIMDVQLLDWTNIHLAAVAGGALFTVAAAQADQKLAKNFTIAIVFLIGLAWGYGSAIAFNAVFDTAAPQRFETRVISAHYTSGKGAHPEFELEPWGPQRERATVPVSAVLYRTVRVGGTVCVDLRPGALQARWYRVTLCGP